MAERDIIEISPDGRVTEMIWDHAAGKVHVGTRQTVDDLLDDNVARQNNGPGWLGRSREMRHVARLDMVTVADLNARGIWGDPKALRKWLNDRDYMKFRTDLCNL